MLQETDSARRVRTWLANAFQADPKRKPAELAAYCKVTPQAVNGWLRTGRVTKANLALAEAFFNQGSAFDDPSQPVTADATAASLGIDQERFARLPSAARRLIHAYAEGVIAAWEQLRGDTIRDKQS